MRWFKHHTDLSRDEGVRAYLDRFGRDRYAAYGFLQRVLEIIAERMSAAEGSLKSYASYTLTEWARLLECHTNRLGKYLTNLDLIDWVSVTFDGDYCRVEVTRMVEWRDETTRKSGVRPEQVAQSRADKMRQEERKSRASGSLSDGSGVEGARRTAPEDFEVTEEMKQWARKEYPNVDVLAETKKFRLYEFSSPISDCVQTWKLWIARAAEHSKSNVAMGSTGQSTDQLAQTHGLTQRPDESDERFRQRVSDAVTMARYGYSPERFLQ